ncbi:hypothetical protein SESBI_28714 [Sesbania bispinosa]|nr:hypothetical protein SESBI_28714 [Sesbania bispinosa]
MNGAEVGVFKQTDEAFEMESFLIRSSMLFWYFMISLNATIPGRNLCGFFTSLIATMDFRAAFAPSCLCGALPPMDFQAICLVRAS